MPFELKNRVMVCISHLAVTFNGTPFLMADRPTLIPQGGAHMLGHGWGNHHHTIEYSTAPKTVSLCPQQLGYLTFGDYPCILKWF